MEFGSQRVLAGINLAIPRAKTLAVIGESGCGKTVFAQAYHWAAAADERPSAPRK